jgi:hypothetical protein
VDPDAALQEDAAQTPRQPGGMDGCAGFVSTPAWKTGESTKARTSSGERTVTMSDSPIRSTAMMRSAHAPICAVEDATVSDPSAANQASISCSVQNRPMSSTLS